jgi:hypothetical protein
MKYDLYIFNELDVAVLQARFDGETREIVSAVVDVDEAGGLSREGAAAFRCMVMAEGVMRVAMGLPEEPDEVRVLRARVAELERALEIKGEVVG